MAKKVVKKPAAKTKTSSLFSPSAVKVKSLATAGIIVLVLLALGLFKNQFVAAVVNGEQISRIELLKELEKSDGRRVLETLVTEKLILQEAEKRNVNVSGEEIEQEIGRIEESISSQGQNLDDLLAIQNFTREELSEQIRVQLLLQKMVGEENLSVTDEEVDEYIAQNQDSFPEDTDIDEIKESVKEQLRQQKLNNEVQNLLNELQQNAKIDYLLPS